MCRSRHWARYRACYRNDLQKERFQSKHRMPRHHGRWKRQIHHPQCSFYDHIHYPYCLESVKKSFVRNWCWFQYNIDIDLNQYVLTLIFKTWPSPLEPSVLILTITIFPLVTKSLMHRGGEPLVLDSTENLRAETAGSRARSASNKKWTVRMTYYMCVWSRSNNCAG